MPSLKTAKQPMITFLRLLKVQFVKQNQRSNRPLVEIPACRLNYTTNRNYDQVF